MRPRTPGWLVFSLVCGLLCERAPAHARADDERQHVLAKPTEFTDVLDAFEDGALPDVRVGLSFRRAHTRSTIAREHAGANDTVSGRTEPVATGSQIVSSLNVELAVGLYRDLMVYVRLPLTLSDVRSLRPPSGVKSSEVKGTVRGSLAEPALFELEYNSATRSGIPGIDLGLAWGVTNQYRSPYLPTWVVTLETRIGFGRLIRPCSLDDTQCGSGINRGTARIALGSRWSYRVHWAEPYVGLRYVHEWATSASERFTPHGDLPGYVETGLPSTRELTLGTALVAWEDRARFQRLAFDVRGYVAYISAGRDYSVLYDALGTSTHPQLAEPYRSSAGDVRFNGLTNVASHARLSGELAVATQAARYIRFRLGIMFSHVTSHVISDAPACVTEGAASCEGASVNLQYRPVIDLPGQRFLQLAAFSYELFASAHGEF